MSDPLNLLIAAAIAALVVSLAWWYWKSQKKRSEALSQVALRLGFTFEKAGKFIGKQPFTHLPLFQQGDWGTWQNVFRGYSRGAEVLIFDYSYSEGRYSESEHTVALFHDESATFPEFKLEPIPFLTDFGRKSGYKTLTFDLNRNFSLRYQLWAKDVEATRSIFPSEVLGNFEQWEEKWVEGGGAWLIVYQPIVFSEPEDIPPFFDEAETIYNLLLKHSKAR